MRVDYSEGDWFAVPLPDGGYGFGLIARMSPVSDGEILGYFFGPRSSAVPSISQAEGLTREDAVMVRRFGHLEVREGRWPIIGKLQGWDRADWPVPLFIRRSALGGIMLIECSDDNPSVIVSRTVIRQGESEPAHAVPDGLLGSTLPATLLAKRI